MQLKLLIKAALPLFAILYVPTTVLASDTAKEKRWESQIVDSLLVGEGIKLKAGTTEFLAIFAENNTEEAQGAAIVLHGSGVHPNWPDVVYPLRTQLPDFGWATLSLQMPVLGNDASYEAYAPLFDEVAPRIKAGVEYLKKKGIQNIVIIAHSLGASMGAYYLSQNADPAVRGFVAIGIRGKAPDDRMNGELSLRKIKLPVLDIYGSEDLDFVLKTVKGRHIAATKAGNKRYQQLQIAGANHFFNGLSEELVKRVRGWLESNAAGMELKVK